MEAKIQERYVRFDEQKKKLRSKLTTDGKNTELMNKERTSIVSTPAMTIVDQLQKGEISALKVLEAFQAKALEVTERINCVTEFLPDAEEWASALDLVAPTKRGPLHGVPVSLKECMDVKGSDTTMGLAKYLDCPLKEHSVVVKTLLSKGAVPFCKTNLSQTMLSYCCSNPVFGLTVHPEDSTRCPGGSSGGEGALIAAGGSILGVGTDLGGSVRVPAAFSGCVGLKPTWKRFSGRGVLKALEGIVGNIDTCGFLGQDVSIVTHGMQAMLGDDEMASQDVEVIPIPWNNLKVKDTKKLTIGWYETFANGFMPTTPGLRRAVREAKDVLEKEGHTLVPFSPPDIEWLFPTLIKIFTADGGSQLTKHLEGESMDPSVEMGISSTTWDPFRQKMEKFMLEKESKILADHFQDECQSSANLWLTLEKRGEYRHKFRTQMQDQEINILLGPVFQYPAPQHYAPAKAGLCMYSFMYNMIDFPAISMPITRENDQDQRNLDNFPEDDLQYRIVKEATRGANGMPLAVQLIAPPWQEETICRVAKELESRVGKLKPRN